MREKLRQLRKRNGYKQKELASKIGITPTYYSLVESGSVPISITVRLALMQVLSCEEKDLKDPFEDRFIQ